MIQSQKCIITQAFQNLPWQSMGDSISPKTASRVIWEEWPRIQVCTVKVVHQWLLFLQVPQCQEPPSHEQDSINSQPSLHIWQLATIKPQAPDSSGQNIEVSSHQQNPL